MSASHKHTHAQWGSRLGFILAAVGSAVGLGNIWKFPYMVGSGGGSAFLFTYLFCIALIGFPVMVAEWMIGRRGQKNAMNSFADVAAESQRSRSWGLVGALGILAGFLILSFYSVIGGWAVNYFLSATSGTFSGMDGDATGALFTGMLGNPGSMTLWHTVFMVLTAVLIALGVTKGIERAAKTMMPLLALILLILVGYAMTQSGFSQAMEFLFSPDFSKINKDVFLAALGHAFFTLSLGMGIMVAYGSYLGKEVNLLKTATIVCVLDTVLAMLAGLAIFPLVFTNGLDVGAGPGLIFVTLPIAFGNMAGGQIIGILFFLLVVFAALTSSISLLEPTVEFLEERTPLSRVAATVVTAIAAWAIGIAALLSFNDWSGFKLFDMGIFDLLDYVTSKIMLPLVGLGGIVFAAWCMNQKVVREELEISESAMGIWNIVARFIAPIGVIVVFVYSLIA